eukprot:3006832-Rhodomonas_salina.1
MALQLQGMILAGGQWQTLAIMCMTDQTLTLETLRAHTFNHSIQYGLESGAHELEAHNANAKTSNQTDKPRDKLRDDIKSLLEAMEADRQCSGCGCKYCPYHKTNKHYKSECKCLKNNEGACWNCCKTGHVASARTENKTDKEYSLCDGSFSTQMTALTAHALQPDSRTDPTYVVHTATDGHIFCKGNHVAKHVANV